MLSDLFTTSIFSSTICKFLYRDEISNVYWSCKSTEKYIEFEGRYIYDKMCLHIHPHGCINSDQSQDWYVEGKRHRGGDLPAIIRYDGTQKWYKSGFIHRDDDLPAIISNSVRVWFINGRLHRDGDLPAIIRYDGSQEWFKNGKTHRDKDLPAVIYSDGHKSWYTDGAFIKTNFLDIL